MYYSTGVLTLTINALWADLRWLCSAIMGDIFNELFCMAIIVRSFDSICINVLQGIWYSAGSRRESLIACKLYSWYCSSIYCSYDVFFFFRVIARNELKTKVAFRAFFPALCKVNCFYFCHYYLCDCFYYYSCCCSCCQYYYYYSDW